MVTIIVTSISNHLRPTIFPWEHIYTMVLMKLHQCKRPTNKQQYDPCWYNRYSPISTPLLALDWNIHLNSWRLIKMIWLFIYYHIQYTWWDLMLKNNNGGKNLDFRLESLPATTRLVPMKESMMIECRIPESAMVREANRHNNVAKPSTIAPKNTLTCQIMANISNYCHFLLSEYFINYYYYLYL